MHILHNESTVRIERVDGICECFRRADQNLWRKSLIESSRKTRRVDEIPDLKRVAKIQLINNVRQKCMLSPDQLNEIDRFVHMLFGPHVWSIANQKSIPILIEKTANSFQIFVFCYVLKLGSTMQYIRKMKDNNEVQTLKESWV